MKRKEVKKRIKLIKGDSIWEERLRVGVMKDCEFHPDKIVYTKPQTINRYTPDFVRDVGSIRIYIESKGRFRDAAEYKKYIYIRDSLNIFDELVFLFMKPGLAMPGAKMRKDGTKRSHKEWAEANDFRWFTEATITQAWLD